MVLSCAVLNSYEPIRFAGTWKQYSKKAIPQLTRMTFQSAEVRYFKWPYQANVMKMFEMVSRTMVLIILRFSLCVQVAFGETQCELAIQTAPTLLRMLLQFDYSYVVSAADVRI